MDKGSKDHPSYQRGREDAAGKSYSNPYAGRSSGSKGYASYEKGYDDKTSDMSRKEAND